MKFKDEYVLARGWPDYDLGERTMKMVKSVFGGTPLKMKYPLILDENDCPKFELVLRKVKK